MTRRLYSLATIGLALVCWTGVAGAQTTETPVAFDSAGRVRSVTPPLVIRLGLTAPTWPVQGDFREARLFSLSTGGRVIAVERLSGAVDRFPISDEAAAELRAAIDAGMARTGRLVTESQTDLVSEPARGAFVRNQMALALTLYSGALATLVGQSDPQFGTAMYLLSAGGSFFIVTGFAKDRSVTRAQNDLATDGAIRGSMFANGLLSVFGPEEPDAQAAAFVTLTGAIGGSVFGYRRARGLTDAEGKAAKSGSSYAMLATAGLLGAISDSIPDRARTAAIIGTGLSGYLWGPGYPRRAGYVVTAGDINTLWIGSTIGVATAFIPVIESEDITERAGWGIFTAGLLGGAFVAERMWVRRYDHTQGEVAQIWLGTFGGALMGGALVVLAEPEATVGLTMTTVGALLGAIGAHSLAKPELASGRTPRAPRAPSSRSRGASLEWSPSSLLLAAGGVRGNHGLLTVRF